MIYNTIIYGGSSSTKSTIIVSIDSGSTVGLYNSSYTTLTKNAVEKAAGQYWITGLDNGTYYIKATKGTDSTQQSYTISQYGVYRINLSYQQIKYLFLYDGSLNASGAAGANTIPALTNGYASAGTGTVTFNASNIDIYSGYQMTPCVYSKKTINPSGYNYFYSKHKQAQTIYIGLSSTSGARPTMTVDSSIYSYSVNGGTYKSVAINTTTPLYVRADAYQSNGGHNYIYNIWLCKSDNITDFKNFCGLTHSSISDILTYDSSIILGNESYVNYMLTRMTGNFMSEATNNATFRTAYTNSAYKSKIDANTHWHKFLTMNAS